METEEIQGAGCEQREREGGGRKLKTELSKKKYYSDRQMNRWIH